MIALPPALSSRIVPGYHATVSETRRLGDPSAASPPSPSSPPPRTARYRPIVEIAEGGMGKVLLVHDQELDRNVVMKVLRGDRRDPDSLRRFLEEARITARLEHPNIVPVYDQATDTDGRPYFTMKMIRGVDLGEIIAARRKGEVQYSLIRILQIFQSICDAIGYAHDQGVIHRDLKPENVMHGDYGEVFVMDWGLAKEIRRPEAAAQAPRPPPLQEATGSRTLDGVVVGTPAYMSPEQARGDQAAMGTHSDLYALGAILYEILTREQPYVGGAPQEILDRIAAAPPRHPREIDHDIPPPLEAICLKAMARDPVQRYATASEMSEDIQHFIEGHAVLAEHLSWWGLLGRKLHRHFLAVTLSLTGLLGLGAVVYAALLYRTGQEADLALQRATEQALSEVLRRHKAAAKALENARPLLDEAQAIASVDPAAALGRLEEAERLAPGWSEIPLARARLLLATGRPGEAEEAFSAILARRGDRVAALRGRAEARRASGDAAGAAADLSAAEALLPTLAERRFREGEDALRRGDAARALQAFEGALALSPTPPARRGRAEALCRLGRAGEAVPDLVACASGAPDDLELRLSLAGARAQAGDLPGAFSDFEAVAAREPRRLAEAHQGMLEALAREDPAEALAAFTAYLDRHPDLEGRADPERVTDGERLVVEAARRLADRVPPAAPQAAALVSRLLGRHPDQPGLLWMRADLWDLAGAHDKTLADLDGIVRLLPREPEGHFRRARTLLKLGRAAEARAALDLCETLLPSPSPRARRALRDLRHGIETAP